MRSIFSEDEAIAWPSYVDFLSTFAFVLILFVGYTSFVLSRGVANTIFILEKKDGERELERLALREVKTDIANRRIVIPLYEQITFRTGCPDDRRPTCPKDFSDEQKHWLQKLAETLSGAFPSAHRIVLQGQADQQRTADPYGNFELANRRAMRVYRFLDQCDNCGENHSRLLQRLRLSNVGDKDAGGIGPKDRSVVVIVDYGATN